jgi:hypothetical protein
MSCRGFQCFQCFQCHATRSYETAALYEKHTVSTEIDYDGKIMYQFNTRCPLCVEGYEEKEEKEEITPIVAIPDYLRKIKSFLEQIENCNPEHMSITFVPSLKKYEDGVHDRDNIKLFLSSERHICTPIIEINVLIPCNKLYVVIAEIEEFHNRTDMWVILTICGGPTLNIRSNSIDIPWVFEAGVSIKEWKVREQFDMCIEYICRNGYSRAKFSEHIKIMFLIGIDECNSSLNILRNNSIADPNMFKEILYFF